MSSSSAKTGALSEPPAKRMRTVEPMQEPELTQRDIAVTTSKVLERGGKQYRVIVQLVAWYWVVPSKEWAWRCLTQASSGEKFSMNFRVTNLIRLEVKSEDKVKMVVDGEEVTGVAGRVFVDEENEVSCEVHSVTMMSKLYKVTKV